ncbi:type IV pilin-like G/H family protein [Trichothermofontia sp.]
MKTELKAKFLQHMVKKQDKEAGFTLIELLVVIIIIGILSAIALPSFLNQANKAKQSEAKTYTGSMNRAQQAYFLENSAFGPNMEVLGVGIATSTVNYQYKIVLANNGATNANAAAQGESLKPALKAYVGLVQLGQVAATSEATTLAVLCENNAAGAGFAAVPTTTLTGPTCASGTAAIIK